jgi:hypothetical protein
MYANITSPKFDKLSTEEISLLSKIATRWKDASTKEIVDFTHEQLPWAICEDMEVIPYGFITQEDPEYVY